MDVDGLCFIYIYYNCIVGMIWTPREHADRDAHEATSTILVIVLGFQFSPPAIAALS